MVLSMSATSRANLIIDPGFEVPSANPADVNLPTTQAGAAANPTFPWYDLLPNSGDQAEISSDIPAFSGAPAADRINSPAGSTGGRTANTGDQYVYAFTAGRTAGTIGGTAQLVTGIVPGDLYLGSAFFMNKADTATDGDRFQAGGSTDSVRMIFEDPAGNQIGPTIASTIGGDLGLVDSTTPQNTWTQVSTLPVAAPPGDPCSLRTRPHLAAPGGGVQFGDDAVLNDLSAVVPEPASLGTLTVAALAMLPRRRRLSAL